jgi:pyruvate formate lyase activating enzyme
MIKKCKENRIHIALDTCGYTTTEKAFTCLKEADLLLYDVKGIDLKEHLRNTTISNELILANLKKLDALENGPDVIVRAIIVPGYNDSEQDIRARAEFLSNLKHLIRVDILPYHEYGTVKYKQLGKEYKCTSKPPNSEYVESIKKIFEQHGIEVHIGG